MKLLLICFWAGWMLPLAAQIRLPSSIQFLPDIPKARETAIREERLMVFIQVNRNTTASHISDAFDQYFRAFRSYGPMILVPPGTAASQLPATVNQGFSSVTGQVRVVVIDPANNDALVVAVPYLRVTERERELRRYRNQVGRYRREQRAARRRQPPQVPPHLLPPEEGAAQ